MISLQALYECAFIFSNYTIKCNKNVDIKCSADDTVLAGSMRGGSIGTSVWDP